jgi:hypothetical protein
VAIVVQRELFKQSFSNRPFFKESFLNRAF